MLETVGELMNYKADEEATAPTQERLSQFRNFLDKSDYAQFFVWVDPHNPELRWSTDRAPVFYEAGKSKAPKKAAENLNFACQTEERFRRVFFLAFMTDSLII